MTALDASPCERSALATAQFLATMEEACALTVWHARAYVWHSRRDCPVSQAAIDVNHKSEQDMTRVRSVYMLAATCFSVVILMQVGGMKGGRRAGAVEKMG